METQREKMTFPCSESKTDLESKLNPNLLTQFCYNHDIYHSIILNFTHGDKAPGFSPLS